MKLAGAVTVKPFIYVNSINIVWCGFVTMKYWWTCVFMEAVGSLDLCMSRYINDVQGNSIQIDKSSGFHVLELHGYTAGVTRSIFVSGFLLICGAYVAFKLGCLKMLKCCCNRDNVMGNVGFAGNRMDSMFGNPQNPRAIQMIALAPAPMPGRKAGEGQGMLDLPLPRVVTLQLQN